MASKIANIRKRFLVFTDAVKAVGKTSAVGGRSLSPALDSTPFSNVSYAWEHQCPLLLRSSPQKGTKQCTFTGQPYFLKFQNQLPMLRGMQWWNPCITRALSSGSSVDSKEQFAQEEQDKHIVTQEDPFDPLTDKIPEKPVTFAEGASYSLVILVGLAVAGGAAYAVFKELIFEPKEYKIFGKALDRVQQDNRVTVRIGSPITGYGQESRNRAARQRIPHRTWTDEDGIERVEVNFYIRGPHGAGKVYSEMFKDKLDNTWKFTYLIVDITSPTKTQILLESYVPA
eukprot:TRINITY_DN34159_c0_g1_i1.p1 TRINITY_DN34159_c0_g1~~TRINITY_DN34159_c0_g1_i1.p1  ORF type:complete len:285 (+),score=40.97 TRINITY_DN34159_c0_g1_i1:203-1057(+)